MKSAHPTTWDKRADVVVIGFGAAGATAAMTARAAGANVIVLEKGPFEHRGGNSRVSGQIVFWPNDVDKAEAYFRAMAGPYMDHISDEMVHAWAVEMHSNRAWLEDLGMQVEHVHSVEYPELAGSECVKVILHRKGPYGEARLWDEVIEPAFAGFNIPVLYDTEAVRLLKQGEAVCGVEVVQKGKRTSVLAARAVILASGGFQSSQAMVRNYLSDMPYCYPLGTPHNSGDGIRMATQVGAELWHMNNIAGPYLAFKAPGIPVCARLGPLHAHSYVYVGGDGRRFVSESANFLMKEGRQLSPIKHGKILRNGRYVQYPCPVPMFIVFDDLARRAGGLCSLASGFRYGWDVIHGDPYQWSADNMREVEKGWIMRANSFSALAERIGLDPTTLESTVADYNAACVTGVDTEWHRPADTLKPLNTPPFYAMQLVPSMLNTQGGPVRNAKAMVMGVDGRPIPRLYSAGELGSIYSHRYQAGGNLGECFAFGRIAGANAAREQELPN